MTSRIWTFFDPFCDVINKCSQNTYQDNDDTKVDHESDGEYVVPPEIIKLE